MSAGNNLLGRQGANFMANLAHEISRNQQKKNGAKVSTQKVSQALSDSKPKSKEDHAKRYLSAKEACHFLGISKATFFRKKAQGYFKHSKITGRYDRNLLEAEVHASTQPSASVSGTTTTIIGLILKYHRAKTLKSLAQTSMKN